MTLVETLKNAGRIVKEEFLQNWKYGTADDELTKMTRDGATPQELRDKSLILELARTSGKPVDEVERQLKGDQS